MLKELLQTAKYTVVLTGAGMSTESGLADFRSRTGLWSKYDPTKLASVDSMLHHQELFVDFYRARVSSLNECVPHKGHEILAKWEKKGIIQSIITQNVDGFHSQAGSKNVAELHGTLGHFHCEQCKQRYRNNVYELEQFKCDNCGGFIRPSVVLFGEMLPEDAIDMAEEETMKADLFIVLGSSLQVSPANYFPVKAKQNGAQLVIVNMEATDHDRFADVTIHGRKIGEVLGETDLELEEL